MKRGLNDPTSTNDDVKICAACGHHLHVHFEDGCHPWRSQEKDGGRLCECDKFVRPGSRGR